MKLFLSNISILRESFEEQKKVVTGLWTKSKKILDYELFDEQFHVKIAAQPPKEFLDFNKNIFSIFFIAMQYLLKIPEERRKIYSKINHLFRIWVTSTDNLLDNEDKETLKLIMPGKSRVMRQVIAIMIADRLLMEILQEAKSKNIFTPSEIIIISRKTLQVLLHTAAEEGFEEGGINSILTPKFILEKIHPLKTGILFQLPLMGPEYIEKDVDPILLQKLKDALMYLGIGCQLLDDIRDLSSDFIEKRANYFISTIYFQSSEDFSILETLCKNKNPSKVITKKFPKTLKKCLDMSKKYFSDAFDIIDSCGMEGLSSLKKPIIKFLVKKIALGTI